MEEQGEDEDIVTVEPPRAPVIDLSDEDEGGSSTCRPLVSSLMTASSCMPRQDNTKRKTITWLILDSDSDYDEVEWCDGSTLTSKPEVTTCLAQDAEAWRQRSAAAPEDSGTLHSDGGTVLAGCQQSGDCGWLGEETDGGEGREEEMQAASSLVLEASWNIGRSTNESHPSAEDPGSVNLSAFSHHALQVTAEKKQDPGRLMGSSDIEAETENEEVEGEKEEEGESNKEGDDDMDEDFDSSSSRLDAGKGEHLDGALSALVSAEEKDCCLSATLAEHNCSSDECAESSSMHLKDRNLACGLSDEDTESVVGVRRGYALGQKRKTKDPEALAGGAGEPVQSKHPKLSSLLHGEKELRPSSDSTADLDQDLQPKVTQEKDVIHPNRIKIPVLPTFQSVKQMIEQMRQPVRPVLLVKASEKGITYSAFVNRVTSAEVQGPFGDLSREDSDNLKHPHLDTSSRAGYGEGHHPEIQQEMKQKPQDTVHLAGLAIEQAEETRSPLTTGERHATEDTDPYTLTSTCGDEDPPSPLELWQTTEQTSAQVEACPVRAGSPLFSSSSGNGSAAPNSLAHSVFRWDDDDDAAAAAAPANDAPPQNHATESLLTKVESDEHHSVCSFQQVSHSDVQSVASTSKVNLISRERTGNDSEKISDDVQSGGPYDHRSEVARKHGHAESPVVLFEANTAESEMSDSMRSCSHIQSAASTSETNLNVEAKSGHSFERNPDNAPSSGPHDCRQELIGKNIDTEQTLELFPTNFHVLRNKTFRSHLKKACPSKELLAFLQKAQDEKVIVCGHCHRRKIKNPEVMWDKTFVKVMNVQGVLMITLAELVRQNLMVHDLFHHPMLRHEDYPAVWSRIENQEDGRLSVVSLIYIFFLMEDELHTKDLTGSQARCVRQGLAGPLRMVQRECVAMERFVRSTKNTCSNVLSNMVPLNWLSQESAAVNMVYERPLMLTWKKLMRQGHHQSCRIVHSLQLMYPPCPCQEFPPMDKDECQWWRNLMVRGSKVTVDSLSLVRFMGHNVFCFLEPTTPHISILELERRDLMPSNYYVVLSDFFMEQLQNSFDVREATDTELAFLTQFFGRSEEDPKRSLERFVFTPLGLHQIYKKLEKRQYKYERHVKAIYYMMTLGHHCAWSLQVTPPTTQLHKVPGYPRPDGEHQPAAMIVQDSSDSASTSSEEQELVLTTMYYDGGGGTPPALKHVNESLNDALKRTIQLFSLQDVAQPFCNCNILATELHKFRFLQFDGVELNHVTQMTFHGHVLHCWKRMDGFYVSVAELKSKGLVESDCYSKPCNYMLQNEQVFLNTLPFTRLLKTDLVGLIELHRLLALYKEHPQEAFNKLATSRFHIKLWKHSCPMERRCRARSQPILQTAASVAPMFASDIVDLTDVETAGPSAPLASDVVDLTDSEVTGPALASRTNAEDRRSSQTSPLDVVDLVESSPDASDVCSGEVQDAGRAQTNRSHLSVHSGAVSPVSDRPSVSISSGKSLSNRSSVSISSDISQSNRPSVSISSVSDLSDGSFLSLPSLTAPSALSTPVRPVPSSAAQNIPPISRLQKNLTISAQARDRLRSLALSSSRLPASQVASYLFSALSDPLHGAQVPLVVDESTPIHTDCQSTALVVSTIDGDLSVAELMTSLVEQTPDSGGDPVLEDQLQKACQCPDRKACVFPSYSFLQCLYTAGPSFTVLEQAGQAVIGDKLVMCVYRGGRVLFSFLDLTRAGILRGNSLEQITSQHFSLKTSVLSRDMQLLVEREREMIRKFVETSQSEDGVRSTASILISVRLLRLLLHCQGDRKRTVYLHKIGHICPQASSIIHRVQRDKANMKHVQSAWMRAFRWSQDLDQQLAVQRLTPPPGCSAGCWAMMGSVQAGTGHSTHDSSDPYHAPSSSVVFVKPVQDPENKIVPLPPGDQAPEYFSLTPLQWEKVLAVQQPCSHMKSETSHSMEDHSNQDSQKSCQMMYPRAVSSYQNTDFSCQSTKSSCLSTQYSHERSGTSVHHNREAHMKKENVDASIQQEPVEMNIQQEPLKINIKEEAVELNIQEEPVKINIKQEPVERNVKQEPVKISIKREPVEKCDKQEPVETDVKQEPSSPDSVMTAGKCHPIAAPTVTQGPSPHSESGSQPGAVKQEPGCLKSQRATGLCCTCRSGDHKVNLENLSYTNEDNRHETVVKNKNHGCVIITYNHGSEHQTCHVHKGWPEVSGNPSLCEASRVRDVLESSVVEGVVLDDLCRHVQRLQDKKSLVQHTGTSCGLPHLVLMGILNGEGCRYACLEMGGRLYVNWAEVVSELSQEDRFLLFKQAQSLHAYLYVPPSLVNERLSRCFGNDLALLQSAPWVCVNTLVAIYNMGSGLLPREKILKCFVDITPSSFFFPFFLLLPDRQKDVKPEGE